MTTPEFRLEATLEAPIEERYSAHERARVPPVERRFGCHLCRLGRQGR